MRFTLMTGLGGIADCTAIAAWGKLGVTDICVAPWNPYDPALDRAKKLSRIEQFSEAVIQRW